MVKDLNNDQSRVIVKNLPKQITEARLKEIFSVKGNITDVRLKYKSSGLFRRFAFIGFQSKDQALASIEYFNDSYIDTSKISLELASSPSEGLFDDAARDMIKGDILESGRLFIRNLSYDCSVDDLNNLFSKFGNLKNLNIITDKHTGISKGYAYATFENAHEALEAYNILDSKIFMGRILHIIPSQPLPNSKNLVSETKPNNVIGNLRNDFWSSFSIASDHISTGISKRLKIDKSDVFDPYSSNSAVKISSAETHILNETKNFLIENGININALEQINSLSRSNYILIAKNFPVDVSAKDIQKIFSKFGLLNRLIIAPMRNIILIEYDNSDEANRAYKNLAYSNYNGFPIFLEWAPIGCFKESCKKLDSPVINISDNKGLISPFSSTLENGDDSQTDFSNSIYVKNLNFSTTKESIMKLFEQIGKVKSIKIATKKDPKKGLLCLGYCFVEFAEKEAISKAIDNFQGVVLDGHALYISKLKPKNYQQNEKQNVTDAAVIPEWVNNSCTKLIVRNIPFEANEAEFRDLIKTFASIKRISLPRRFDKRHRGFGFIDFISHNEALNAFFALKNTHFYGRHLHIEWAHPDK